MPSSKAAAKKKARERSVKRSKQAGKRRQSGLLNLVKGTLAGSPREMARFYSTSTSDTTRRPRFVPAPDHYAQFLAPDRQHDLSVVTRALLAGPSPGSGEFPSGILALYSADGDWTFEILPSCLRWLTGQPIELLKAQLAQDPYYQDAFWIVWSNTTNANAPEILAVDSGGRTALWLLDDQLDFHPVSLVDYYLETWFWGGPSEPERFEAVTLCDSGLSVALKAQGISLEEEALTLPDHADAIAEALDAINDAHQSLLMSLVEAARKADAQARTIQNQKRDVEQKEALERQNGALERKLEAARQEVATLKAALSREAARRDSSVAGVSVSVPLVRRLSQLLG